MGLIVTCEIFSLSRKRMYKRFKIFVTENVSHNTIPLQRTFTVLGKPKLIVYVGLLVRVRLSYLLDFVFFKGILS